MPVKFDLPDIHSSALTIASSQILHPGPDQEPIMQDTEVIIEPEPVNNNSIPDYEGLTGDQIKALLAANRPQHRPCISGTTVSGAINGVCVVVFGTICSILLCFEDVQTRYTEVSLFVAAILGIMCPAAYSCFEVPRQRGRARRRAIFGCRVVYVLSALSSIAVIACAVLSIVLETMSKNAPTTTESGIEIISEPPMKLYLLLGTAICAALLQIFGGSVVAFMALVDNHR